MKYHFLFNPFAGKGKAERFALELDTENAQSTVCQDLTKIDSYENFLSKLDSDEQIVICGGDGTLNGFINRTRDILVKNDIIYYPAGSGNDFMKDCAQPKPKFHPRCSLVSGREQSSFRHRKICPSSWWSSIPFCRILSHHL